MHSHQAKTSDNKNGYSPAATSASGMGLQCKLTIGSVNDPLETEADAMADRVMRMPEAPLVQRKCVGCDEEDKHLQRKPLAPVSESSVSDNFVSSLGSGQPLDRATLDYFEPRFGADFSAVRLHADNRAAESAGSINARAYTLGNNVVFGAEEYQPQTIQGKRLLAHELTHVVQQGRAQQQIQRLTVTQHALTKGTCGQRNVQWIFSLDKPAPEDGYIVQQVDRSEYVETCPNVAYGPAAPLPTFWEAWFVKKGDKVDWLAGTMKYTDGNTRPARPGTNGSDSATGTIKFFTKATTGDLGVDNKAPADPKSPWGPGKVPNSGALPSTPKEPSWWSGTPVEGPANRGAWASWNCCDADKKKHSFDLKTKP